MTTAQHALADAIEASAHLLTRFLDGFDDTNHIAQAPGLPNHAAWTLGHCALTLHRCAQLADGQPPSPHDFRTEPPENNNRIPMRYYTESVCFGSSPSIDNLIYPSIESGIMIYERACQRLAETIRNCSDEQLDQTHPWGDQQLPFRQLVARVLFHNGMHAGQLTDLRRALAMPPVIA